MGLWRKLNIQIGNRETQFDKFVKMRICPNLDQVQGGQRGRLGLEIKYNGKGTFLPKIQPPNYNFLMWSSFVTFLA